MARHELEEAMALLGWSKTRLAHKVYVATYDDDDPVAMTRLAESIKKEFQRPSTKPERFERYLRIAQADPEYARLGRVVPHHVANKAIDKHLITGLARISEDISRQLVADEWSRDGS